MEPSSDDRARGVGGGRRGAEVKVTGQGVAGWALLMVLAGFPWPLKKGGKVHKFLAANVPQFCRW